MRGAALKEGARLIKWIWRGSWLRARLRGGMADEGAANKTWLMTNASVVMPCREQ